NDGHGTESVREWQSTRVDLHMSCIIAGSPPCRFCGPQSAIPAPAAKTKMRLPAMRRTLRPSPCCAHGTPLGPESRWPRISRWPRLRRVVRRAIYNKINGLEPAWRPGPARTKMRGTWPPRMWGHESGGSVGLLRFVRGSEPASAGDDVIHVHHRV